MAKSKIFRMELTGLDVTYTRLDLEQLPTAKIHYIIRYEDRFAVCTRNPLRVTMEPWTVTCSDCLQWLNNQAASAEAGKE